MRLAHKLSMFFSHNFLNKLKDKSKANSILDRFMRNLDRCKVLNKKVDLSALKESFFLDLKV